jgi:cell cycle protein kinase DBF2
MLTNRGQHSSHSSAPSVTSPISSTQLNTVSGLPEQNQNDNDYYRDVHMDTAKGLRPVGSYADVHMATAKGLTFTDDITMDTVRGGTTLKQGGLQMSEKQLLESSEVRRKATVAQLCMFQSTYTSTLQILIT